MLKDLQQRQGEQSEESSSLSLPVVNHQPKNVLLIIIITVILTLTAVYMLHLHDENQRLKNNAIITASNVNKADITVDTDPNKKSFIKPLPIDVLAIDESAIVQIANKESELITAESI